MTFVQPSLAASRIWLIGLMGSGKTTVGQALSAAIGAPYVDNDAAVAELAGRSTLELAAAGGELLHDWESRYVHQLVETAPPLVAGIPASTADRRPDLELLRCQGLLVYLRADLATLAARVEADQPRPWLHGDPRPTLAQMLEHRDPVLVATAGVVVDAAQPPAALVETIAAAARQRRP